MTKDPVRAYLQSLRPAKPDVGDFLVSGDGTQREVTQRVDHCHGATSVKISNPDHWVFDAAWFVKFHGLTIEKSGANA